jgi:hypothetical protein
MSHSADQLDVVAGWYAEQASELAEFLDRWRAEDWRLGVDRSTVENSMLFRANEACRLTRQAVVVRLTLDELRKLANDADSKELRNAAWYELAQRGHMPIIANRKTPPRKR